MPLKILLSLTLLLNLSLLHAQTSSSSNSADIATDPYEEQEIPEEVATSPMMMLTRVELAKKPSTNRSEYNCNTTANASIQGNTARANNTRVHFVDETSSLLIEVEGGPVTPRITVTATSIPEDLPKRTELITRIFQAQEGSRERMLRKEALNHFDTLTNLDNDIAPASTQAQQPTRRNKHIGQFSQEQRKATIFLHYQQAIKQATLAADSIQEECLLCWSPIARVNRRAQIHEQ